MANGAARRLRIALAASVVFLMALPSLALAAGAQATFNGHAGSVSLQRRGASTTLQIPGQPAGDVSVKLRVSTDTIPVGDGQVVSILVRRAGAASDYRARIQFGVGGSIKLSVNRVTPGQRTMLAGPVPADGVSWQPRHDLSVRIRVRGTNPAVVSVKVWPYGTVEPGLSQLVASDSSPATDNGASGRAALRFSLPADAGRAPVSFDFADLTLAATGATDPTPTPTPMPTPTPTDAPPATDSPSPTPSATGVPTPTAPPSAAPTQAPSPTPSATPSAPTPTPTTPTIPPLPSGDGPIPTGAPVTQGTAVFVATNGDDTASGTVDHPWRTVQKAADAAPSGSTIYLRAGTYGPFVMRRSGQPGAPTTFTSYPGETAIVDGLNAVAYTITLTAVHDVALTHLVVQGGYAEAHEGGGIIIQASTNVTVSDSLMRDNKAFGVRSQKSTSVTIERNEVTRNAVGVHIGELGAGTVVANNLIHDNDKMMVNTLDIKGDDVGAGGITLVKTVGHVVVRNNYVWGNRALSYDYGYDGSAFEIFAAQNWEFTDNVAWDNRVVFETGTDATRTPCSNGVFTRNTAFGPATVDVARGVVLRCAENALIANNTFVGLQDFAFTLQHQVGTYGGSIDGLRIVNNVLYLSDAKAFSIDSAIPASVVIDSNLVYKTGSGYLATMVGKGATNSLATLGQWLGQDVQGIQADPDFVDMAAHDYRLEPDSPAVDSGVIIPGLTDDYSGAGPDRGSVESTP